MNQTETLLWLPLSPSHLSQEAAWDQPVRVLVMLTDKQRDSLIIHFAAGLG